MVYAVWYCSHYLPPVSLIPVVHLDLQLSSRIRNDPTMLFSGVSGKTIHEKNLKQKISWHCPFKPQAGFFSIFTISFSQSLLSLFPNLYCLFFPIFTVSISQSLLSLFPNLYRLFFPIFTVSFSNLYCFFFPTFIVSFSQSLLSLFPNLYCLFFPIFTVSFSQSYCLFLYSFSNISLILSWADIGSVDRGSWKSRLQPSITGKWDSGSINVGRLQQTETLDPQRTEPREVALIGVLLSVAAIGDGQNLFCDGSRKWRVLLLHNGGFFNNCTAKRCLHISVHFKTDAL